LISWLWVIDIDQFEKFVVSFEYVGITLFANFTLKLLPVVAVHFHTVLLIVSLCFNPVIQTLKVDETH